MLKNLENLPIENLTDYFKFFTFQEQCQPERERQDTEREHGIYTTQVLVILFKITAVN